MKIKRRATGLSMAIQSTLHSSHNGQPLLDKKQTSGFTIKIANTLEEKEIVYKLAYQVYLSKGFIKEEPNEWLVKNYDMDDDTIILIVKDKNSNIVGTVTLVFDGSSHLPAEKIYKQEINSLKCSGEKIVEISRLVINPDYRNSKEILVLLFNYLVIYSYHVKKYSCLAIEVNPRHILYYKELLGFEVIGDEKPCPSVQNAPAILMFLPMSKYQSELIRCNNLNIYNRKERSLYKYFIRPDQEKLVSNYLEKQKRPITNIERNYFCNHKPNTLKSICI